MERIEKEQNEKKEEEYVTRVYEYIKNYINQNNEKESNSFCDK